MTLSQTTAELEAQLKAANLFSHCETEKDMFSQSSPSVVLRERSLSADAKQQVRARVTSILHGAGLWSHTAVCVRVHCRYAGSVQC